MKLTRIDIYQFGKLKDRSFTFGDGIQLISGENESGKSTFHTAAAALLFGMGRGRGRAAQSDTYHNYLPWSQPELYGGKLSYERDGRHFEIERDFSRTPPASRILRSEGESCTEIPESQLELPVSLTPFVFFNTLSFRQMGAATDTAMADELRNHILNLQTAGDETVNVAAAINDLRARKKAVEKQIDSSAAAEAAAVDRALDEAQHESLSGSRDLEELKARKEARDLKIAELSDERSRKVRDIVDKQKTLQRLSFSSQEQVDEDRGQIDKLREELLHYDSDYRRKGNHPVLTVVLSYLLILLAFVMFFFFSRCLLDQHYLPCIPLFIGVSLAVTAGFRLSRQSDADTANRHNEELLKKCIKYYQPDYEPKGTSREAEMLSAYLEKVSGVFTYLQDLKKDTDEMTEELLRLSADRSELDALLEEQMRLQMRREQWERKVRDLEDRRDELDDILAENDRLAEEAAAISQAVAVLTRVAEEAASDFGTPLTETASSIFREITGGRYEGLRIDNELGMTVLQNHKTIKPSFLSTGALEQVYFSFRMAAIRLLWPDEAMPLFFDDSFAMYDKERLGALLSWLADSYRGQVFLFTCSDREEQLLTEASIPFTKIRL